MPELTTYLKKLQFDPQLKKTFFGRYLQNTRLVILVVLLVLAIGISSFLSLPRVLNPQVNIPIVMVSTALPGASPDDVESLVTIPIEESVSSLQKVKTVTSSSQDSVSLITLEFETGVDPDKAQSDVQAAVDSVNDLPEDAQSSNVQKLDFENEPIWTFTLHSDTDYLSLVRFGKTLRDGLKDLPSIDRVTTTGLDNEEIQVLLDPAKLALYGINPQSLMQTIQSMTGSFPAGTINTQQSSFILTVDPTITTVEQLRSLRISSQGSSFALSDIAEVTVRTKPNVSSSYFATASQKPVESIRFDVYKTSGVNITSAIDDAKHLTNEMMEKYGNQFVLSTVFDSGEQIDKQYYDLIRDLLITVSLVFLTLFLFLGIRQAFVASLAIPLTFLITFIVMKTTGVALSFIAFFSLLLSLGLLVDDTIVIISALTAYYRTNKFTPLEAGLLVWRDFKTAILTTTLTTVWAFVPLLLSTGIIGEFIKAIPIVVSSTLLGSFVVAVFITLPFIIFLLGARPPRRVIVLLRIIGMLLITGLFFALAPKGVWFVPSLLLFVTTLFIYFQVRNILFTKLKKSVGKKVSSPKGFSYYLDHGVINFEKFGKRYRRVLDRILSSQANRKKVIIVVIIFSLFSFFLLPFGFVRNEFFPKNDQEFLFVSLKMPAGTNLEKTKNEALKVLNEVRTIPEVKFTTSSLKLSVEPGRGYAGAGENNALITIVLLPAEERKTTSIDIADSLRQQFASYSDGEISVVEATDGPPAGADIQIKLSGDDLTVLDSYATQVETYLKDQPGLINVSKSITSGTSKIVFVPDAQKLVDNEMSQAQVGMWLRTYASGFTLEKDAQLHTGSTEKQDIVLRTAATAQTVEALSTITIPVRDKPAIPLASLGTFELRPNPTLITRENGKRTISISSGVAKGVSSTEKNAALVSFVESLNLPAGYSWSTGGVNEENQNSVNAILAAMLFSFMLIIITMVLQFSSFRKALIVMLVIPLSISGVFIVFALTRTPLSFPALIGVLALFGIVVKNAILIVDKINQNLKEKMQFKEAIVDASESRLEPIALTTFATIVGLIPITLSDPLWQGLGGAIIAGLFFSGSIMLFFIPVVYYLIFQSSEGKKD